MHSGYARSPSPVERGLYVSQKELHRMKQGHRTPLRTNPVGWEDARLSPRSDSQSLQYQQQYQQPPHQYSPSPRSPPASPPLRPGEVHTSHAEFSLEKSRHATPVRNRHDGASPSVSPPAPAAPPPNMDAPWASINSENPYQFKDPLPPTNVAAAKFDASPFVTSRKEEEASAVYVGDPVYEWQKHRLKQQPQLPSSPVEPLVQRSPPVPSSPAPYPPSPPRSRLSSSLRKNENPQTRRLSAERSTPAPRRLYYTPNLSGDWVAMPGSEEVLEMVHDQDSNRLVGVGIKEASWSEVKRGEKVEGVVDPVTGEVRITLDGGMAPVLRLIPTIRPSGALSLLPPADTHGNSGYWDVVPTHIPTSPLPVPRSTLSSPSVVPHRDTEAVGSRVHPRHEEKVYYDEDWDEAAGTVINIYT